MIATTGIFALGLLSGLADAAAYPTPSFDYVIVGSGPGGSVVANRLTENSNIKVAVIEAGTYVDQLVGNMSSVPGYNGPYNVVSPSTPVTAADWGFITVPQVGLNGQRIRYARGKTLGGSSNLNAMAWSVSTKGAFDRWGQVVGDSSWNFNTVFNYYKKAENFTPPANTRAANTTPAYNPADVGSGGPLQVTFPAYSYAWPTWLALGLKALGVQPGNSFLGGTLTGSAYQTNTIDHKTAERSSAFTAYIQPFSSRPNLYVFDKTMVQNVVFNGTTATGVVVSSGRGTWTIQAKREVILAAGVFQSPQLLQISGVGPAATLKKFGIKVVADRPGVGQNMNDHLIFGVTYRVNLPTASTISKDPNNVPLFNNNQTGPLTNPGGEYVGFENIPSSLQSGLSAGSKAALATLPSDWPQIQYLTLPNYLSNGRSNDTPADNNNYASIIGTMITPFSRGNVSISSAKVSDPPLINPAWLTNRTDVEAAIAIFKRLRQVWGTDPLKNNISIGAEVYPGSSVSTDAQIEQHIRNNMMPIYHGVGTNKMGPSTDPLAVVDPNGKVYGTKRLRVIDCSVMPFLPPGPAPQAITYMLAEKLADAVKASQ